MDKILVNIEEQYDFFKKQFNNKDLVTIHELIDKIYELIVIIDDQKEEIED